MSELKVGQVWECMDALSSSDYGIKVTIVELRNEARAVAIRWHDTGSITYFSERHILKYFRLDEVLVVKEILTRYGI
jgi:hypothetical protein